MPRTSWNWLAPRLSMQEMFPSTGVPARPCLPAMEALDDRILLSIAPESPTAGQVLAGIVKAGIVAEDSLFASEMDLLQKLGTLSKRNPTLHFTATGEHIKKAVLTFREIDDVFFKFGVELIKGEVTELEQKALLTQLNIQFNKLNEMVGDFGVGEDNLLLPAVQKLENKAMSLFGDLTGVKVFGEVSSKDQQILFKISQDFLLGQRALLDSAEDLVLSKKSKGQEPFLIIKMEDVLISSARLSDSKLGSDFEQLANGVLDLAATLSLPGELPDLTLLDNTGDLIA